MTGANGCTIGNGIYALAPRGAPVPTGHYWYTRMTVPADDVDHVIVKNSRTGAEFILSVDVFTYAQTDYRIMLD